MRKLWRTRLEGLSVECFETESRAARYMTRLQQRRRAVVLQSFNVKLPLFEVLDSFRGGFGAGDRREIRHLVIQRAAPNVVRVRLRVGVGGRVNDERDFAVFNVIADMRAAVLIFVDDLCRDATR